MLKYVELQNVKLQNVNLQNVKNTKRQIVKQPSQNCLIHFIEIQLYGESSNISLVGVAFACRIQNDQANIA